MMARDARGRVQTHVRCAHRVLGPPFNAITPTQTSWMGVMAEQDVRIELTSRYSLIQSIYREVWGVFAQIAYLYQNP